MTVFWLQTYTGIVFDILDPTPGQIAIEDIAHALALQCRFNGHTREFYSIAEHSVHVACVLRSNGRSEEIQRIGLLHDAVEAYVGDLVAPIKALPGFASFSTLERVIWEEAIAPCFGLPQTIPSVVKRADLRMLATEASQLLSVWPPSRPWNLPEWATPYPIDLFEFGLGPCEAELAFMREFVRLYPWSLPNMDSEEMMPVEDGNAL